MAVLNHILNEIVKQARVADNERKTRTEKDLITYGGIILESEEMRRAFRQTHHVVSTVGDHTLRVAETSLAACYTLEKLGIKTDVKSVVQGALCHDLGILGREEKYSNNMECCRRHPADSVEVARKLTGSIPQKTADIIERHMWPFGGCKFPNSLEGVVVSVSDKAASATDVVMGCSEKCMAMASALVPAM